MLLSAMSVLVVAQSSSEIPEGLMNNPELISFLPLKLLYKGSFSYDVMNLSYLIGVIWELLF